MPTIKQVAERAGVSIGTVSHVITGSVPVSPRLRARVETAIRELDYLPNHVARSLKTSKTRTLGIIVPDMTIPFFPRVIRGAEAAALERNYSLIAVESGDNCVRQEELLLLLRSQQVEGVLLISAGVTPTAQISGMMESGISLVCLDRIPDGIEIDSVSVDNAAAAQMGVAHLLSMGHRQVALVTGPLTLRNEQERLQGYWQALGGTGLRPQKKLVWEGNFRPEDVATLCRKHLSGSEDRPSAVFSTNGPTGLGVLRAFHELGLETPGDIGFATFDELTVDTLFTPRVTTVTQPEYDIGFRAAQILLQRIHECPRTAGAMTLRLPARLAVRDSSRLVTRPVAAVVAG